MELSIDNLDWKEKAGAYEKHEFNGPEHKTRNPRLPSIENLQKIVTKRLFLITRVKYAYHHTSIDSSWTWNVMLLCIQIQF